MINPTGTTADTTSSSSPSQSADIDSQIQRIKAESEAKIAELKKMEEQRKAEEHTRKRKLIEDLKKQIGFATDAELIAFIRGKVGDAQKGKRLPESTLKLMKLALKNGASAPSVAQHFKVSLATVHTRKKQWGYVGRKNVKTTSIQEALKGSA